MSYQSELANLRRTQKRERERDDLLVSLPRILREVPDMRFGQLLLNAVPPGTDLYNVEDGDLLAHLEVFADWVQTLRLNRTKPDPHYWVDPSIAYCTEWPFRAAPLFNAQGKTSGGRRRPRFCSQEETPFPFGGECVNNQELIPCSSSPTPKPPG